MRSTARTVCATGAALGVLAWLAGAGVAAAANGATAHPGRTQPAMIASDSCYSQLHQVSHIHPVSQKFDPRHRSLNNRGADDFTLQQPCTVQSIDVAGEFFYGSGPLLNAQLVFYRDDGTDTPGAVIARRIVPAAKVTTTGDGDFHVPVDNPVVLDAGAYWFGFRIRMDLETGEWAWQLSNVQRGRSAVWKNAGGGIGDGCTTYQPLKVCFGDFIPTDYAFALNPYPVLPG